MEKPRSAALPPRGPAVLWLLAKGTAQSPFRRALVRPWDVSRRFCGSRVRVPALKYNLILLPHQSRRRVCVERGRDGGLGAFHPHRAPFPPHSLFTLSLSLAVKEFLCCFGAKRWTGSFPRFLPGCLGPSVVAASAFAPRWDLAKAFTLLRDSNKPWVTSDKMLFWGCLAATACLDPENLCSYGVTR